MVAGSPNNRLGDALATLVVEQAGPPKNTPAGRRKLEAIVEETERLARLGHWEWDEIGDCCLYCSKELARLHGHSVETFLAKATSSEAILQMIHPDDRELYRSAVEGARQDRSGYEVEYRLLQSGGDCLHVREVSDVVLDADGRLLRSFGYMQDITERQQIEEALRRSHDDLEGRVKRRTAQLLESEARYRRIFDTAAIGIGRTRLEDGRVMLSNRRLAQMFGYDDVSRFVAEFVFSERYVDPSERARLMTSYREHPGSPIECAFIKQDGTVVVIQAHAIPNYEEGFLDFVATDITAQRAAEERLRQAQKMEAVGQLTGGIAHDFNNLLAVIMGNIELLQDRLGPQNQQLSAVYRSAKRGAELTQRLLAFSRQQPLKPQAIDVGGLVTAMSDLLNRSLGETIAIEISRAADLWQAHADPGQVENALLNLALNARDAMPEGGLLTITCSNARISAPAPDPVSSDEGREVPPGDYVVLGVRDNGHGMSMNVRAHALEPFFTTKEVGQGSGLGLSMVYGFAKQSGGQVVIDSLEGQGTTVQLYLPRREHPGPVTPSEAEPEIAKGNGEGILVIEDDHDVGALVVTMLEDLNYRAQHAESAAEARAHLARRNDFAVLLSDVVLPGGKTGPTLVEEIRKDYPELKVIFMSGHLADAADGAAAVDLEAPFLPKPFRRRELAKTLHDLLSS